MARLANFCGKELHIYNLYFKYHEKDLSQMLNEEVKIKTDIFL